MSNQELGSLEAGLYIKQDPGCRNAFKNSILEVFLALSDIISDVQLAARRSPLERLVNLHAFEVDFISSEREAYIGTRGLH